MKIALISDSHTRVSEPWLVKLLTGPLAGADLILHAGDLTGMAVCDLLEAHEVLAVSGNCDSGEVAARLPLTRTLALASLSLGLAHGWGSPAEAGLKARSLFEEPLDILVHGHSHRREILWWDWRGRRELWLDPGSVRPEGSSGPRWLWLYLEEGREPWAEPADGEAL